MKKASQAVVSVTLLAIVILLVVNIVGTNNSSQSGTLGDTAGVMPLEVVPAISDNTSDIVEASSTNIPENGSPSLPLLRATEAVRVVHRQ